MAMHCAQAQLIKPIKIDQFGYPSLAKKVAVISSPVTGYNAGDSYTPSSTLEVRRSSDNVTVFSGEPVAWNSGVEHTQSGDMVWWLDFSALIAPGAYYIYDPVSAERSYTFVIENCVYNDLLKQSMRTFYYQRCGVAKATPYAGTKWADAATCHLSANQDLNCRAIATPTDATTAKDLSGGWHDAGDYNKYINFASETLHHLLSAYEEKPNVWGDNYELPESYNGVPDILDEVKWELDWFLKMQQADGSVLHKLSVDNFQTASPPSNDKAARYYGAASTSATLATALVLAHAAIIYKKFDIKHSDGTPYHTTLLTAAEKAWVWASENPAVVFSNTGYKSATNELNDYQRLATKVSAAGYLFAATNNTAYQTFFDSNYTSVHLVAWPSAYPFEPMYQDALLYYANLSNATSTVASNIRSKYANSVKGESANNLPSYINNVDAYRAYLKDGDYGWGSNRTKAHQALLYTNMLVYGFDAANAENYSNAALGYVNYLHGVNPNGLAYLSNMGAFGAENSINEFYHGWFGDGTNWDNAKTSLYGPAPCFLPGGPNPDFKADASYSGPTLSPPLYQPIQKSYKDWNTSWPENSWFITESSIHNQSAYTRLLSHFVEQDACSAPMSVNLLYFKAQPQKEGIKLEWKAIADEATVFKIERSEDGQFFETIAAQDGLPTGNAKVYSTWDTTPKPSHNFYRISYVTGLNTMTYSNVITIDLSGINSKTDFEVSPNPAENSIRLHTFADVKEVRITNLMGKVVYQNTFTKEVNVSSLSAGLYVVQLVSQNGAPLASRKFLKK
ncbi:glycoside hydrolase family 9 protein [Pontibacter cellulosilyticus]|uniref:Glycoside hydrolase family 9 protein n=1 Tax=Pontibacter cellulosilyticus TaxID=1720253 RepID=A0A923SHE4_9BACT|nr:glycoside hydrolase family 9 protein [Pontibacter cellulosilyticus]MBC5991462.1 glycoside hydrolase family 9 protein [Pontibacter cellulosilyticus]